MKRIISLGAAFLFVLSAGMTSYAGHHAPCASRVIQGSGLCWYGENLVGGHHLFGHEGWTDCGACGVDVGAICDGWESCHNGYGAGTAYSGQGTDAAPESQSAAENQPTVNPAAKNQPAAESQPTVNPAAVNPAGAQTGNGTAAAGAETYGTGAGYQNYNGAGAGYGGGGHCYSGSYTTGHHGSGHHGCGRY